MVSEVGKTLLEAAAKGYSIEIMSYREDGKLYGLKFHLYDEHGNIELMRVVSYDQFRYNRCDPVNYTILELIFQAEYAKRDAKNNG